ncbi:DUF3301 domain-containing protein [Pseudoalteromonas sp. McH1-7]|uniref:DUF3301 domain-containing protein n=1 Tax=Pseudoalteromonas peptidolytica F12-50-A1 TaxID=1315280 RepID=A0A8I0T395_9GAMM|nr:MULTISPECIES: DUF3301 domain-containing protein [Pseudoalteromonas]MBE0345705.1 hypothetical protein [Pseudoalteromonas peptidolytica F12-50-A1]MDW7547804.1 DUF3301 domain-containing protein [Pseudoalteromonas peptidolytica]NLR14323.1 DUF3301 domain-containing protein [Pseudoalteromonas peptidolytica]NUZ11350.1 DUF3301 domain-containing protein [Pseudoalteromonas sp. McH1-7]RRS08633.1 DUF3301 domain-containing protein [Pseudoalteromonas sp. J010]
MTTLWLFIIVSSVIALFWYSRQIAEAATRHAQHQAESLQVQLLSVACTKRRIGVLKNGKLGIKSQFMFEFSSDGESAYQGKLYLENERLVRKELPAYRVTS